MARAVEQKQRSQKTINLKNQSNRIWCLLEYADGPREVSAEPEVTESIAPEVVHDESPVNKTVEIPTTGDPVKDYSELHELRTRLTDKDSQLSSLQEELSALKSQEVDSLLVGSFSNGRKNTNATYRNIQHHSPQKTKKSPL